MCICVYVKNVFCVCVCFMCVDSSFEPTGGARPSLFICVLLSLKRPKGSSVCVFRMTQQSTVKERKREKKKKKKEGRQTVPAEMRLAQPLAPSKLQTGRRQQQA